ncbi:MAG: VanZ family protein, partial [Burkholderiales bacterium]|nr:VanZ family protein [Burkholderiales bacterium]
AFSWVLPKLPNEVLDDLIGNLLGYLPLGLIMCLAHLRSGSTTFGAAVKTLLVCSAWSYAMELIQFTLPTRVPSISDWSLNTLGAAWGALAAVTVHALGLVDAWHRLREEWFIPQAGHGLALIWLWPLGLLFPPPVPLGQGQLWPPLRLMLIEWTQDTPWQDWLVPDDPLALWAHTGPLASHPAWSSGVQILTVALGLLAPMCVACAFARPRITRLVLLSGAVLVAVGTTTLSTAINYGVQYALTWVSIPVVWGLMLGALGGVVLIDRSRTACAALGMLVLVGLIGLIHLAPADPYYAQTLQSWEQGRFIRFHGLARWFGLLWPYVALVWLGVRLVQRDTET